MLNSDALGKYELLLALKSLDFEFTELTRFTSTCEECYLLLKERIDKLCGFITNKKIEQHWELYSDHEDVKIQADSLRRRTTQAICDMEKYYSVCVHKKTSDIQGYFSALSDTVTKELSCYHLDETSKVLFIGSGAFPLSALTIAKYSGASVLGLDIDAEAVRLANQVAEVLELNSLVQFSGARVHEIPFAKEATHIFIASLVEKKWDLLKEIRAVMNPDAKIIVRYGNGLKSIFNFPIDLNLEEDWVKVELPSSGTIYDTVLLSKLSNEHFLNDAVNM